MKHFLNGDLKKYRPKLLTSSDFSVIINKQISKRSTQLAVKGFNPAGGQGDPQGGTGPSLKFAAARRRGCAASAEAARIRGRSSPGSARWSVTYPQSFTPLRWHSVFGWVAQLTATKWHSSSVNAPTYSDRRNFCRFLTSGQKSD